MEVTEKTLESTLIQLKQMGVPPETALGAIGVLETEEQFQAFQKAITEEQNLTSSSVLITAMMVADRAV